MVKKVMNSNWMDVEPINFFGNKPKKQKKEPTLSDMLYGSSNNIKEKERDTRRTFGNTQKKQIWYQQNGKCARCHKPLNIITVEYDHIKSWADKGKTITENGAALCRECHGMKNHEERHKKFNKKRTSKQKDDGFGLKPIKW